MTNDKKVLDDTVLKDWYVPTGNRVECCVTFIAFICNGQFYQHFMLKFFVWKCFPQLLSTYTQLEKKTAEKTFEQKACAQNVDEIDTSRIFVIGSKTCLIPAVTIWIIDFFFFDLIIFYYIIFFFLC